MFSPAARRGFTRLSGGGGGLTSLPCPAKALLSDLAEATGLPYTLTCGFGRWPKPTSKVTSRRCRKFPFTSTVTVSVDGPEWSGTMSKVAWASDSPLRPTVRVFNPVGTVKSLLRSCTVRSMDSSACAIGMKAAATASAVLLRSPR